MSRHHEFLQGARDMLPMLLGAMPFGIIFGSLAAAAGLTPWQTIGMSVLVFAGSAQFIALSLLGGGATLAVLLLTTFVVNLRHALYSASLQPFVRHLPKRWRIPLAFWLTDEAFAVVQHRYAETDSSPHKHWYFLGAALAMFSAFMFYDDEGYTPEPLERPAGHRQILGTATTGRQSCRTERTHHRCQLGRTRTADAAPKC